MLTELLKDYTLILASGSPRRKKFLEDMGLEFEVRLKSVEENYPAHLKGDEISDYLAKLKASVFLGTLEPKEILITSDTVVWLNDKSLAKAKDSEEAFDMILRLSGDWHEVITSVCFTTDQKQLVKNSVTKVKFRHLNHSEIQYYIDNYSPFDKAGAYGIQEWIGLVGIEQIQGSYTNVVGLPTQMVYETLQEIIAN